MNQRKRKKILKKHKKLLKQILAILDEVDPMRIIFAGQAAGFDIDVNRDFSGVGNADR